MCATWWSWGRSPAPERAAPGKIAAGFVLGSRDLYAWLDHNDLVELHRTDYINDPCVIGQNYRQVAINGAIEVDLTGQVCADSIGPKLYSECWRSDGLHLRRLTQRRSVPIIALPSTARNNTTNRIVPTLKPGAGVVTHGITSTGSSPSSAPSTCTGSPSDSGRKP